MFGKLQKSLSFFLKKETKKSEDSEFITDSIYNKSAFIYLLSFFIFSIYFSFLAYKTNNIFQSVLMGLIAGFFLSFTISTFIFIGLIKINKIKVLKERKRLAPILQAERERKERERQQQEDKRQQQQREQEARIRQQAEQQRKAEEVERQRQARKEAEALEQKRRREEEERRERGRHSAYFSTLEDNFHASQSDEIPPQKTATIQPVSDQTEETERDEAERLKDLIRKRTE